MAKLQFDERQYKLTLPKKLLEALGWKKGDRISIRIDNSEIILNNHSLLKNRSSSSEESSSEEERIEYAR